MFMMRYRREGFVNPANVSEEYLNCHLNRWYPHQSEVEMALVIIALLCIPVMLVGRPLGKWLTPKETLQEAAARKASSRKLGRSKNLVRIRIV